MKIKMLTTSCGPDPKYNFNEGQKRNVTPEEARYWHEKGYCELLEPYPSEVEKAVIDPAEKAVVAAPEKAVIKPPETVAVKVSPEPVKAAATAPVKPAKAAAWGTPEGGK